MKLVLRSNPPRGRAKQRQADLNFKLIPTMLRLASALLLLGFSPFLFAQTTTPMTHHAQGTFKVNLQPAPNAPAPGLSRLSINKEFEGDIKGTSQGEMISGGDPKQGAAGYVAMEVVTGTLMGKTGSFALQHMATMNQNGPKMSIVVVPGSGTGELKGISGEFQIQIANGQHSYTFDYTLPQ